MSNGRFTMLIFVVISMSIVVVSPIFFLVRDLEEKSKIPKIPKTLKEQPQDRFQLAESGNFSEGSPFFGADYCVLLDTNTGYKYIYFRHMGDYHFERIEDGGTNVQR